MNFYEDFINSLFSEYNLIRASENDLAFEADLSAGAFTPKAIEIVNRSLSFLRANDSLICTVVFGNADPISYYSDRLNTVEFINNLTAEYTYQEGEPISIKISISKRIVERKCSVYSLDTFIKTLKDLSVSQFLTVFTRVFANTDYVAFKVFNLETAINTAYIHFIGFDQEFVPGIYRNRTKYIENFNSVCHYSNTEIHRISPIDFKIINIDEKYKELIQLFEFYSVILSIIYLFDITTLIDNQLEFKVNGYKAIKGSIDLKLINNNNTKEYFEIFKWVYNGGNLNDKVGLARNIISLHFIKNGELDLQGYPFQSIQSSYKVYEKQNIKQYIEIRNKISDQLIDFNNRASKIVESFASGFQKSALALISFYVSAIVIRVLSKGNFVNIFSFDATVLSIAFILGSFIYFLVSRWEISEQRKRFEKSYLNLKLRYADLLEENDIKRILNNDKDFNEDLKFIDDKKKVYSIMWACLLALLGVVTLFLFFTYNLAQLTDTFLFKLIFSKN